MGAASGESVDAGTYYLGRPWAPFSRVVFQNTALGGVVNAAGWTTWNGDASVGNVFFGEYGNTGAAAAGSRVSWARRLRAPVDPAAQTWCDAAYPAGTAPPTA